MKSVRLDHALVCVLVLAVISARASDAHADDWSSVGLDETHARATSERSGPRFDDGRWTSSPASLGRVLASPAVADGVVIVADLNGSVRALDAVEGRLLWTTRLPGAAAVHGSPTITRGLVLIPAVDQKLYALHLTDGSPAWNRDLGGMALSAPTPWQGSIFIAGGFPGRRLFRLNSRTGDIIWASPPTLVQSSNAPPAVGEGFVVVGAMEGHYQAFDVDTGLPRWSYEADGIVHLSAPVIASGRAYFAPGGTSDQVHSVALTAGTSAAGWPITLPAPDSATDPVGVVQSRQRATSSPAIARGLVFVQTRVDQSVDSDADGQSDQYLSREMVVALDAVTGSLIWQHALARAVVTDFNDVPKFWLCPTPAVFAGPGGTNFLAVSSSLDGVLRVLDAGTGTETWSASQAGPSLASPLMANGRIISVSVSGDVTGTLSSTNRPPSPPAPTRATSTQPPLSVLRWASALDPDGDSPSYEVRVGRDGAVGGIFEDWERALETPAGQLTIIVAPPLVPETSYVFAVRARDPSGAYSPWSELSPFQVAVLPSPPDTETPLTMLQNDLASAMAGDVVHLGPQTYHLTETLRIPAGVSLAGASAGRSIVDGTGLDVAVELRGGSAAHRTSLTDVTVASGQTGVLVVAAEGARLEHVIVRDHAATGVTVNADATASIVNTTVVHNGVGVRAFGATIVKNSLLIGNEIGLSAERDTPSSHHSTLSGSSYNDLVDNVVAYRNVVAGLGDLAVEVAFSDRANGDFHLPAPGASTDQGDPADAVGAEPAPNGARINLGAFGGTVEAETTAAAGPASNSHPFSAPPDGAGGCSIAGSAPPSWPIELLLGIVPLAARRRRREALPEGPESTTIG